MSSWNTTIRKAWLKEQEIIEEQIRKSNKKNEHKKDKRTTKKVQ